MKTFRCLLLAICATVLVPIVGFSQETPIAVKTARILDTQEVDFGDRKITYNRVETPRLKPEPEVVAPVPVEPVPMTAQEEEELRKWEAKFQYSPFLGVTVYDGAFSEIRWWDDGQENVVWSNVNFLHFAPFADLETDAAYYSVMLSGWETTTAEAKELNAAVTSRAEMMPLPPATLPPLSQAGPKWQAASPLSEGAKRAMNDFHEYYSKHGAQMAVDYVKREEEARFTTTGDKFFVRLRYWTAPTSDPEGDDFDQDGVSNLLEVQLGSNPMGANDADDDGLGFFTEIVSGTNPAASDAARTGNNPLGLIVYSGL
jgi:hypothetical protein